jgi:hypothetical protein
VILRALVALALCLVASASWAAVAFDAKPTAYNSADGLNQEADDATSISATTGFTVGAGATLLVAVFVYQSNDGTDITARTATWNGAAMTEQATVFTSLFVRVSIFTLVNPASGANTLAGAWTNASDCYMSAVSFTGTDTATGVEVADNVTATQTTTITVTSTTDGATVAVFGVNGSTPTVNFTKIFAEAPLAPGGGASYTLGGTSSAHTFTGAGGTFQALAGVHVIAGAGGTSGRAIMVLPYPSPMTAPQ